jgi:type VI secretion system secreted protein VgrG
MFLGKVDRLAKVVTSLGEALLFNRLEGSDGLSRNGEYRVTVLSRRGDIQADELLGRSVSTVVTTPRGSEREFNGLAVGFYQAGQQGRYHQYLIVVRPWTWLLTRTSDCRIFQEKTVRDIISVVLADHPYADFEFQLTGSYSPWTYCVQYRETDFNFLARLMEQEGMHFFFRHQGGKHTLVIADGAQAHEAAGFYDTLPYIEPEASRARQDEGVREWSHGSEIQPTRFIQRDFNFEKPRADMQADARPARPLKHDHAAAFEVFDYPGEYEDRSEGQRLATVRMEEMRYQFDVFNGESNAAGLATGRLFRLSDHPRDDQNQEYLIVGADYHVEESPPESEIARTELFSIRFRAIPSAQSFQPPRLTPKPIVQGPQTAIVVGKAGEEIHTDKYGRVKVQFHWDRYGKKDENSSCWIRVSHPWAGQNWGMIAIPRTGQEVIVEFLEGDPDRPIITGRVYNADQMPPYALPANMTQTGIKTRSSKGGGVDNFNEIRFDDKMGAEQLYIHAEKNQDGVVENDETLSVGHDRTKTVGNDEKTEVKHDRTETVGNNETITIGKDRTESVGGNETVSISKDRATSIEGNETLSVTRNRDESVEGNESVSVTGKLDHSITGAASYTSTTSITLSVGGSTVEIKPTSITLSFGASSIKIDAMGIAQMGPKISLNG